MKAPNTMIPIVGTKMSNWEGGVESVTPKTNPSPLNALKKLYHFSQLIKMFYSNSVNKEILRYYAC